MESPTSSSHTQRASVRAAVVGAGLMGRWHAHALTHTGGRLDAVADPDVHAAQDLARIYRARAFASLDDLLQENTVDVLHICAPLEAHQRLAERGLDAGAHVLVEKPITPDADSALQLLAYAQVRRRLCLPVHQFLFQPGIQTLLARRVHFGRILHLEATAYTAGAQGRPDSAHDELAAEILPHALSLFQRVLPDGLDGVEWTTAHPSAGELRALGQAAGISCALTISTHARPTRNTFLLAGEHGTALADLYHGYVTIETGEASRSDKLWRPFGSAARTFAGAGANLAGRAVRDEPAYPGLRELIRRFYDSVRDGSMPPILPEETLAVARARDHLCAAAGLTAPEVVHGA